MSDDFEHFLDAARRHARTRAPTAEDARRVAASLDGHIPLQRPLSAALTSALAVTVSAATKSATDPPVSTRSWLKIGAVVVPALGLAIASYSVATFSSNARPTMSASEGGERTSTIPSRATPATAATPVRDADRLAPPRDLAELPAPAPTTTGNPVDVNDLPDADEAPLQAKAPSVAARPGGAAGSSLEAELALLSQVTSALHTNRPGRALVLVEEHGRRFRDGALTPEFAAQKVIALASLGRQSEACAESARFLAKYPNSPFVSQVRSSCADPKSSR